jgi:DNA replication and repair protein RecF
VSLTTVDGLDPEANVEEIEIRMSEMIGEVCGEEFRRGLSLVGPHRDDLALTLNGNNLQRYASQGQHKTMLIALKMAEFVLMGEQRNEAPIFILDDVFSELDEQRSRNLISVIRECGQTIITSTEESRFHSAMQWNSQNKRFKVRNGICTEA